MLALQFAPMLESVIYGSEQQDKQRERGPRTRRPPQTFSQSLNSGDLDALVALYAFDGFLLARSGPARGISEIRKALAGYIAMKPTIQLTTRRVIQVEDTALLVGDWRFQGTAPDGGTVSTSGTSIEVARRQPDGSWRYLIDLPNGPD
jgi:ketosteroid isomerase-like protein